MAVSNHHLNRAELHLKPLCAHLGRGATYLVTHLQKRAHVETAAGRCAQGLAKFTLGIGSLAIIPIALIESVAFLIFAGFAISINRMICDSRSLFWQNVSVQLLSHAFHSAFITVLFFTMLMKNPNLSFFTANAAVDQALYLGTAVGVHLVFGTLFDVEAGRDRNLSIQRVGQMVLQHVPHVAYDLLSQVQRDFDIDLSHRIAQAPQLQAYWNEHPHDLQFLRGLQWQRLTHDEAYQAQAAEILRRILERGEVVGAAQNNQPALFELNPATPAVAAYQERLKGYLKAAFLEIYRTPNLVSCLDREGESGKELLKIPDAAVFMPLATYAQYKEICEEIQCPERFNAELRRYDSRREQLLATRQKVLLLGDQGQSLLQQKILRGADLQVPDNVQEVYREIAALADPLVAGPLVTKVALNIRAHDLSQLVEFANIFKSACDEAIALVEQQEQRSCGV